MLRMKGNPKTPSTPISGSWTKVMLKPFWIFLVTSPAKLADPHFFYVVDVNDRGCLRNLFWAYAKSRLAYTYFSDVVAIETACLTAEYQVPLVLFLGINHHKQSILFGSGLLAGNTIQSYAWLFRAWLTCILGCPPQVIITDQCGILQTVVADVFPRSTRCLCLLLSWKKFQKNWEPALIWSNLCSFEQSSLFLSDGRGIWSNLGGHDEKQWN